MTMADALQPGVPNLDSLAPEFDLATDGGGRIRLSDLKGRNVVFYFYPKDDTTGCTKEAIDFTAAAKDFADADAVIVGASKDSAASHDKFKRKYQLGITLAADPEGDVVQRYGSWVEKSMYGRTYMGIERSTFLIDRHGVIRRIWRKVKTPGHAAEVLKALQELNAG
jgi:peroxiredoxin Q/BCP